MPSLDDRILEPGFEMAGLNLIEASAGTGKTHNIQTLYLRLVVEHGLPVRQVLTVTFTDAATAELRDRLRSALDSCLRYLDGADPRDDRERRDWERRMRPLMALPLRHAPAGTTEARERRARVYRALVEFDEAAVSTIHGFCLRTLEQYAFESGHAFDAEVAGDDAALAEQVCADWWRRNAYGADRPLLDLLDSIGLDRERLARHLRARISKPDAAWHPPGGTVAELPERLAALLRPARNALAAWAASECLDEARYKPSASARRIADGYRFLLAAVSNNAFGPEVPLRALAILKEIDSPAAIWTAREGWPLPRELADLARLAAAFKALTNRRRPQIAWRGTDLHHDRIDSAELNGLLARIRAAWQSAEPVWQRLVRHPDDYPLLDRTKGRGIRNTLDNLSSWFRDAGAAVPAQKFAEALSALADLQEEIPAARTRRAPDVISEDLKALANSIRSAAFGLVTGAVDWAQKEYARLRRERGILTFTDQLTHLRDALQGAGGDALVAVLSQGYRAALIDEFQDTDPVQYAIFRRVFIDTGLPVFLVGDPKQAIYAFRSGDVFMYHEAKARTEQPRHFSIATNYRSTDRLIRAVNQVFRAVPGRESVFGGEIAYADVRAPEPDDKKPPLQEGGTDDRQPFRIWYYADAAGEPPAEDSEDACRIYADTADEIVRLLDDPSVTIEGRRVRASDIAVLILTHVQAALIQRELRRRGVPSVRQSTSRVFDTPDARDLAVLLEAIRDARSAGAVRAALATRLFGYSPAAVRSLAEGGTAPDPLAGIASDEPGAGADEEGRLDRMDAWLAFFQAAHERWRRHSFMEAFNFVVGRTGLRSRVLAAEGGVRSLTNILHLAELLHHAIREHRLSMEGALRWFAHQLNAATREEDDAFEIRLDTDEQAVRILTVFVSKGLQFPIVFVPTLWGRRPSLKKGIPQAHRRRPGEPHGWQLVVSLDPGETDLADDARQERLDEDTRLLYVAATRAIQRTYLVWGSFARNPAESAMARVFGTDPAGPPLAAKLLPGEDSAVTVVGKVLAGPHPAPRCLVPPAALAGGDDLRTEDARTGRPPWVNKYYGHASFSALAPHGQAAPSDQPERRNFDAEDAPHEPEPQAEGDEEVSILSFPAGARTGECWHRIFETLDFGADDETVRRAVNENLDLFRLSGGRTDAVSNRKRQVVFDMVRDVLGARLDARDGTPFRLSEVGPADRTAEFEFHYPLPPWPDPTGRDEASRRTTEVITETLRAHWPADERKDLFLRRLDRWSVLLPQGYMTGFMDLLFRHHGRYFILDWKSNRCEGTFHPAALDAEMARHAYFIQYLIYTVAAHRHLSETLGRAYRYGDHFGGVFYVFLRGARRDTPEAIYFDRPAEPLVGALSQVLGDFD